MQTWIHGGQPGESQAYAEYLARNSSNVARTPDEALYFVSDNMEHGDLVVPVGNTVAVSSTVHPGLRDHLARIGIWALEHPTDPFAVADACQSARQVALKEGLAKRKELDIDPGQEIEDAYIYDVLPDLVYSDIGEMVAHVLTQQRKALNKHMKRHGRNSVDPLVRQQIKLGLGRAQQERAADDAMAWIDLVVNEALPSIPTHDSGTRLVMPFSEKGGGKKHKIGLYRAREQGDTHTCAECSGHIFRGDERVTQQMPPELSDYSDHHHTHLVCILNAIIERGHPRNSHKEDMPAQHLRNMGAAGRMILRRRGLAT